MGELRIRVQPRAKRDEVVGEREGAIVIRVSAPPVDGRANRAVVKLVAKRLGVAPSRVRVVRGDGGRDKVIAVDGVESADAKRRILA